METSGTLRYYLRHGETISAHHEVLDPPCTHAAELDLIALAERFGPDFNIVDNRSRFLSLLRCTKCRRKGNMAIILSPANRQNGREGQHLPMGLEAGS